MSASPHAAAAAEIAVRVERELGPLVGISSPSGDVPGAELALELCAALLPTEATIERVTCSTDGNAPDLVARVAGTGTGRVMLLGHVDTVIDHEAHTPLRRDGERLYGPGTCDMKGGVLLSLGVASALAGDPSRFAELAVLLVTDEEWRTSSFVHVGLFDGYDACLCFEAGERGPNGEEGVVVRRKAAATMRVSAVGRAAHAGSAPDAGRNALVALSRAALEIASRHDPAGADRLSVVPTVMRSGDALNVVPAVGVLIVDMRADRSDAFGGVIDRVPSEIDEVRIDARLERLWPGMDSNAQTADVLGRAGEAIGRPVVGVPRGGASDASHYASSIPLTIDGLGPRGGGAHTPGEFVLADSLRERAEVALAVAHAVLDLH